MIRILRHFLLETDGSDLTGLFRTLRTFRILTYGPEYFVFSSATLTLLTLKVDLGHERPWCYRYTSSSNIQVRFLLHLWLTRFLLQGQNQKRRYYWILWSVLMVFPTWVNNPEHLSLVKAAALQNELERPLWLHASGAGTVSGKFLLTFSLVFAHESSFLALYTELHIFVQYHQSAKWYTLYMYMMYMYMYI